MFTIPLSVNAPITYKSSKPDYSRDTMYYGPSNICPFPKGKPRKETIVDHKRTLTIKIN